MWSLVVVLACSGGSGDPTLPEEGVQAREALRATLVERDAKRVGPAARAASAWEGQDDDLDLLLGDALANVLMRPSEGLPLLEAHPRPDDPEWRRAILGAALRAEDSARLSKLHDDFTLTDLAMDHPVLEQVGARARLDPKVGFDELVEVVETCQLLDAQPLRGRQQLDSVVPPALMGAARALGAHRVVMGRAHSAADPDPVTGRGAYRCQREAIVDTEEVPGVFPSLGVTFAATDGTHSVWMDAKLSDGTPLLIAANDRDTANRWIEAGHRLDVLQKELGDRDEAAARLVQEFEGGLFVDTQVAPPGL